MGLRAALRAKLVNVVDEVVARHRSALTDDLRAQNAELRVSIDERVRVEVERVLAEIRGVEIRDRRDTFAAAEREAVLSTARFVQRELRSARHFGHPHATLEHALSLAPPDGMACEFGVFTGTTLKIIAAARDGAVYGFDSFDGLPENWRAGFPVGAFGAAAPPDVPGAELIVGLFADTLPGFLAEHPGPVDVLHIDSDLYSSAACVLAHVGARLRSGSVVIFDEFFNYPGWEQHEAKAWQEHVAAHDVAFRYEAYTIDHEQVVLRVL